MRTDVIFQHEHWQAAPYLAFVAEHWYRYQSQALPAPTIVASSVPARINQGRWVVDCPAGCGGALCVSAATPLFICIYCGSAENGGRWYAVAFPAPATRTAIEDALLARPADDGWRAHLRNWELGETVADLLRQNQALVEA